MLPESSSAEGSMDVSRQLSSLVTPRPQPTRTHVRGANGLATCSNGTSPLGFGCLNLSATPQDEFVKAAASRNLFQQRDQMTSELAATIATPRPVALSNPSKSTGSIASIRWSGN